jgi:hypothetical protein
MMVIYIYIYIYKFKDCLQEVAQLAGITSHEADVTSSNLIFLLLYRYVKKNKKIKKKNLRIVHGGTIY